MPMDQEEIRRKKRNERIKRLEREDRIRRQKKKTIRSSSSKTIPTSTKKKSKKPINHNSTSLNLVTSPSQSKPKKKPKKSELDPEILKLRKKYKTNRSLLTFKEKIKMANAYPYLSDSDTSMSSVASPSYKINSPSYKITSPSYKIPTPSYKIKSPSFTSGRSSLCQPIITPEITKPKKVINNDITDTDDSEDLSPKYNDTPPLNVLHRSMNKKAKHQDSKNAWKWEQKKKTRLDNKLPKFTPISSDDTNKKLKKKTVERTGNEIVKPRLVESKSETKCRTAKVVPDKGIENPIAKPRVKESKSEFLFRIKKHAKKQKENKKKKNKRKLFGRRKKKEDYESSDNDSMFSSCDDFTKVLNTDYFFKAGDKKIDDGKNLYAHVNTPRPIQAKLDEYNKLSKAFNLREKAKKDLMNKSDKRKRKNERNLQKLFLTKSK